MKLNLPCFNRRDIPATMDGLETNTTRDLPLLLRPAVSADRRKVYSWLVVSDATSSMMGSPRFSDRPVPGWEKFCADYSEHFFLPDGDGYGRVFILCAEGREIGYISYYGLNNWRGLAELDICIAASADCGKGWGSRAMRQLADELFTHPAVESLIVRPSHRNRRAIAACRKAGFVHYDSQLHELPAWVFSVGLGYHDAVLLLRTRSLSTADD